MKRKLYLLILSSASLFFFGLSGIHPDTEPPIKIKFNDLGTLNGVNGKVVEIRGFLYESKEGTKILSNEPNLRTCCIASKSKREKQILISGNIEPSTPQHPITVQGLFSVTPSNKENGEEGKPLYQIEKAIIIQDEYNNGQRTTLFFLLAGLGGGTLFLFFGLRRFQLLK